MTSSHPRSVECAILIPAGPDVSCRCVADTVSSVLHYVGAERAHVVVVDDSREARFRDLQRMCAGVTVLDAPDCREGKASESQRGTLFTKQAAGLRWIMKRLRFESLLKLDTDALVIGPAPHHDARAVWDGRPDVGVVGAFTKRGDGSDKTRAMAEKGRQLSRELRGRGLIWSCRVSDIRRTLHWVRAVRRLVTEAERHGYARGSTCTGGAYFVNPRLLQAMEERGFLEEAFANLVAVSGLTEDSLVGLLAYACGFALSDPLPDHDTLAINWRGLPMSLPQLVLRRMKIVHPIRDESHEEADVRAFFAARRESESRGA